MKCITMVAGSATLATEFNAHEYVRSKEGQSHVTYERPFPGLRQLLPFWPGEKIVGIFFHGSKRVIITGAKSESTGKAAWKMIREKVAKSRSGRCSVKKKQSCDGEETRRAQAAIKKTKMARGAQFRSRRQQLAITRELPKKCKMMMI